MWSGIHILLTYSCTFECDHCFLYCSPRAEGTFTLARLREVFAEIDKMPGLKQVYFEGGEPFLYYPLMLEGLRMARQRGLFAGLVTNAYWAQDEAGAELWLAPIKECGIDDLSISDDLFHQGGEGVNTAQVALAAARRLGLPAVTLCTIKPALENHGGEADISGNTLFRGRAVEKLAEGLPRRPWESFIECPHEDLANPSRVHVDAFGTVHLCQGLSMGNCIRTPLSELEARYDPMKHPICKPLIEGGPARLAREAVGFEPEKGYVDACHLCFEVRRHLLNRYPGYLGPTQVYGLK